MAEKWREYQEAAAEFFRSLGFKADVDVTVRGTRSKHDLDVLVQISHFGIPTRWIVECKDWKRNVTKEKVIVLQGIVADIGADKGILLSEKGFQRGAYAAAENSNVILSNLSKLKSLASGDLENLILHRIFKDAEDLSHKIINLGDHEVTVYLKPNGRQSGMTSTSKGIPGQMEQVGKLSILKTGLERALYSDDKRFLCGWSDEAPEVANSKAELIQRSNQVISDATEFYSNNADRKSRIEHRKKA